MVANRSVYGGGDHLLSLIVQRFPLNRVFADRSWRGGVCFLSAKKLRETWSGWIWYDVAMDRPAFLRLLALPGKRIDQDLVFEEVENKGPNKVLRPVDVFNTGGFKVRLEGHYHPLYQSITFNFVCAEAGGPICRLDVRGQNHKEAGRTHKHDLHREQDPRNNLPAAHARDDLAEMAPVDIWRDLCTRAHIQHTGRFFDPRAVQLPLAE